MTASALGSVWQEAMAGARKRTGPRATAPDQWAPWLRALFPRYVAHPFGERHAALWEWAWAITPESTPDPFVGIWPRGGGKTTSAELAAAALGCRGSRRYVLYVRMTQERADDAVTNIATLLESEAVARYYPEHADRLVSKFGASRGWRRNRLRTAGGFTVDAIGLDTAARGVKVDEQRPDLIILDDIDDKLDSLGTTAKKIAVLTTSILPAGASNAAVLAIQNLIIPDGFFTRMVDGRADYLARRIVSGPHPAIEGLVAEPRTDERTGVTRHVITSGTPTWAGQDRVVCQQIIDRDGISAFRKECQHEVRDKAEGLALRFDERRHLEDLDDDAARSLVRLGQAFGGIDFGAWRFGFVLRATDTDGRPREIAEYFSQRESHDVHAQAIHGLLTHYGAPHAIKLWGDAANPSDITELNAAFKRQGSPYRVVAVAQANKIRKTSVDRLNDLLDRGAIRYRRGVTRYVANVLAQVFKRPAKEFLTWRHGYNAASAGTEMEGSRLLWEVEHWAYPVPQEGKAQEQDPDDHTADGADLIAADRYAIMSWWRPGKEKDEPERSAFDPAVLAEEADRSRRIAHRIGRKKRKPMDHSFGDY